MDGALGWISDNGTLLSVLGIVGGVSLLATIALLPFLVVRIPEDYFRHSTAGTTMSATATRSSTTPSWSRRTPGLVLILAGVAMLVLPGQGLLTLLIGLMLTTSPASTPSRSGSWDNPGCYVRSTGCANGPATRRCWPQLTGTEPGLRNTRT